MTSDQVESYVDAAAAALALPIAPAHRPGVIENFSRLALLAAAVNEFPLGIEDEPAPVWKP